VRLLPRRFTIELTHEGKPDVPGEVLMEPEEVRKRVENALRRVVEDDQHLLENDLGERCIASRLAMYLQQEFPEHSVDVEYNRVSRAEHNG
jgi:hypothetical protein